MFGLRGFHVMRAKSQHTGAVHIRHSWPNCGGKWERGRMRLAPSAFILESFDVSNVGKSARARGINGASFLDGIRSTEQGVEVEVDEHRPFAEFFPSTLLGRRAIQSASPQERAWWVRRQFMVVERRKGRAQARIAGGSSRATHV